MDVPNIQTELTSRLLAELQCTRSFQATRRAIGPSIQWQTCMGGLVYIGMKPYEVTGATAVRNNSKISAYLTVKRVFGNRNVGGNDYCDVKLGGQSSEPLQDDNAGKEYEIPLFSRGADHRDMICIQDPEKTPITVNIEEIDIENDPIVESPPSADSCSASASSSSYSPIHIFTVCRCRKHHYLHCDYCPAGEHYQWNWWREIVNEPENSSVCSCSGTWGPYDLSICLYTSCRPQVHTALLQKYKKAIGFLETISNKMNLSWSYNACIEVGSNHWWHGSMHPAGGWKHLGCPLCLAM